MKNIMQKDTLNVFSIIKYTFHNQIQDPILFIKIFDISTYGQLSSAEQSS
jgi:hypothetical protein